MKNLPDIPSYWLSFELSESTDHTYKECTAPALAACDPLLFYHQSEGMDENLTLNSGGNDHFFEGH